VVDLPFQCAFFVEDSEYSDLDCGELAAKQYLRLINSADYRSSNPSVDDCKVESLPLPSNLLTEGRRLTPALKVKINRALLVSPLPSTFQIRVYQLFHMAKFLGYRYNYKLKDWEQR
jgi:hypothetical protein